MELAAHASDHPRLTSPVTRVSTLFGGKKEHNLSKLSPKNRGTSECTPCGQLALLSEEVNTMHEVGMIIHDALQVVLRLQVTQWTKHQKGTFRGPKASHLYILFIHIIFIYLYNIYI